jgi:glycosyltransferase involved in cell wall biosynthesis
MHITVAICTWNRVALLARTLEELVRLHTPAGVTWDVLVVNNGSTDGTEDFLRAFQTSVYPIRWVTETRLGLSAARNRALLEQQADLIFYTDDDVIVDPGLMMALAGAAERFPEGAAFGGVITPWFPREPDADLVAAFPSLARGFCGVDLSRPEGPLPDGHHLVGANMAYRCSLVNHLSFREDLGPKGVDTIGGDEIAFQDQIRSEGRAVVWIPGMTLQHYVDPVRMTLPYLLRFAQDAGRKYVRLHGVPTGRQFAGVPRWLIGNAAKEYLRALICMLRFRRTESLSHRRLGAEFLGMVKESRSRHMEDREGRTVSMIAPS